MAADRRRIDRTDIWILTEIVPVSVAQEKVEPRQEDVEVREKKSKYNPSETQAEVPSLGNKGANWFCRRAWALRRLAHLHRGAIRSYGTQTC